MSHEHEILVVNLKHPFARPWFRQQQATPRLAMEEGSQKMPTSQSSSRPNFPAADAWHGDRDINEDVERHRAQVFWGKLQLLLDA